MKQITVTFSSDGGVATDTGECNLGEILYASKLLELGAVTAMKVNKGNPEQKLQTLLACIKTLLLPFDEKVSKNFNTESALQILPIALKELTDNYSD